MIGAMTSREDPADRAANRLRRQLADIVDDMRQARLGSGLSQKVIAGRVGISRAAYGRFERGDDRRVPAERLARMCGVLGLELSVRVFAGGRRLRDGPQVRALDRFRKRWDPVGSDRARSC